MIVLCLGAAQERKHLDTDEGLETPKSPRLRLPRDSLRYKI